ncbi:MAG: hypothetical protein K6C36_09015 [Clostridia bacterium]|nr:hypothetical protein [Clostridia bacterium]
MKRDLLIALALFITVAAVFSGCGGVSHGGDDESTLPGETTLQGGTTAPGETQTPGGTTARTDDATVSSATAYTPDPGDPLRLTDDIFITEVFSYSGAYVEDGQDEQCDNICAVRLRNDSATHYEYLRFTLETTGGSYSFTVSTLFAGAELTVLCNERSAYTSSEVVSSEVDVVVPWETAPSVHTESLEITYTDGFVNVRNKTEAQLSDVYVYYKAKDDRGWFGGITYRVPFGDIPAGEIVQQRAEHLKLGTTEIVFATYAD